ncbi:MAG: RNA methyltransferase [Jaaginema sp. PMC 1079.18]|nr:RNA methyltransferase [Jaaginema sp. PMC 1080.18]MEC4853101.1 RNA methyltransferase [Jaaginema sp. PMC 1079.18]MEC4867072.1 RNA methyltransferase [Jaaginema sp. PMC 1078.18]
MLTSTKNPWIKQLRKLRSRSERHKQAVCLIEGTHLLERACEFNYTLSALCATPDWIENHTPLWQQAQTQAERTEIVTAPVLEAIATTVNPDGVIATLSRSCLQRPFKQPLSLVLALDRLQDPGNLGTILRSAAATSASGLWLSEDSVDLDNPKVLRASAGEGLRFPVAVCSTIQEAIAHSQGAGLQVVATLPQAELTYWEADFTQPTLLVLGNEGAGLSPELAAMSDVRVKIPLSAGVESLNVAIAAALLLYEVQRQRGFQLSVNSQQSSVF